VLIDKITVVYTIGILRALLDFIYYVLENIEVITAYLKNNSIKMKTVLNVKTDVEVKKQAQELAKYLGVPLSTVVNAYLKEFIHSGEFTLRREPQLRPEVAKRIEKAVEESKEGKNLSPAFSNVEDAMAWLNK